MVEYADPYRISVQCFRCGSVNTIELIDLIAVRLKCKQPSDVYRAIFHCHECEAEVCGDLASVHANPDGRDPQPSAQAALRS